MNQLAKRFLSVLMVLALCLGCLPGIALAEGAFTVSFSENGTVTSTQTADADQQITLPLATALIADYNFVGWVTERISETTKTPAQVFKAGEAVTVTEDMSYYALYSRTESQAGGTAYELFTGELVEGSYLLTYNNGAMKAAIKSKRLDYLDVSPVDNAVVAPDASIIWELAFTDDGYVTLYNQSTGTYAAGTGVKNNAGLVSSVDDYAKWTVSGSETYDFVNLGNELKNINKTMRKNGTYGFACYATSTGGTLTLYKLASGDTVYYSTTAGVCDHANTTVTGAVDATCTEAGYTGDTLCADCGAVIAEGEETAALGHNMVDGTCTVCGETVADLSGDYYIAAQRSSGIYWYMTSDLGTASTKRYTAVDTGLTELPASITAGLADRTFTLTANDDGTYAISVEGQYLGWTSGNSGALVAADKALALTVEATESGAYTIVAASNGRNLSLNNSNAYFAFYTGTQINDLYLIPVEAVGAACEHTNTELRDVVAATCTAGGYTGDTVCVDCGELVAQGEKTDAIGHINEDGDNFCDVCGAQVVSDSEYKKTTVIKTGDVVLLINEAASVELSAMSTTSTTYGIGAAYTNAPVGLMPLTVVTGAAEGTVAFQNAEGLYLAWLSGNSLKTVETLDANSSWTVTFDNGNAVIVNNSDAARTIRWNKTSPRFACYTSGQTDVQLYKLVTADACKHETTTVTGAVAATCTEAGYTGNTVCSACGETVVFGTTVDALDHDMITDAAVAATCTTGGLTEGSHCSRCDKATAQKVVMSAGHSYADGLCTVCGGAEIAAPDADQILADAYALKVGDALPYTATLTGVITNVDTAYNETYQNITVTITVGDKAVMCYRLTGEGAADLAVGDTISVTGNIINYNGTIEFASGCQLTLVTKPAPKEYCLVGYINGANYGCEEDWENVGQYIFVDGTLSTSFTADSYVFVKTTDSVNWYLAEAYCTDTTCTFINGGTEKLFVPGNVELTFTLTENEDGSLTVSYETGAEIPTEPTEPSEPEAPAAYYVTGDFAEWNPADEAYLMAANEDGTYSLTFAIAAGDHALKVTNGTWDSSWGGWGEGGNYEFTAFTDGEITVTFDGETVLVSGDCLKGEEPTEPSEPEAPATYYVTGDFAEWNPADEAFLMNVNEDGTYSLTFAVTAGKHALKVTNGTWDQSWGGLGEGGNYEINATTDGEITVTFDGTTVMVSGDCLGEIEAEPLTITSMHVAGSAGLTGVEWDPTANKMDCAMGVYTITFTGVAAGTYEYKFVANGTGDWGLNWASGLETVSGETYTAYFKALGNSSVVVAEDNSTVTLTFNMTTMDIVTGEGATCSALVEAPAVAPSIIPTLKAKYPTVSFEDVIILNIYFDAQNTDDVVEMGMLTFPEKYETADIALAEEVLPGYVWNEGAKLYTASTNGIPAKELGKTIYFAVYAKLADGTYAYSTVSGYSVEKYAKTQLTSATTTEAMKALMVATLNYAAAAQVKFDYNADALVNASLTDEQKALIVEYSDDMITAAEKPDAAKLGEMVNNGGYTRRYPTVSFEGAFSINFYFAPSAVPVGDITMYVWTQADYNAATSLSKENASYAITMEKLASGEYQGVVENIAAKQLNDAVYVSFCYSDGTTDYCAGVIGYSIGVYCKSQAAKTGAMAELAKATAVYGYYAKQRFG